MLAGRSVLAWQAGLALDLGCERIICLCEAPTDTVLALQREIERSGAEFHAIRSNLQLVSLVRADDELVMILDGLLPDRAAVMNFVGGHGALTSGALRKGVATLPASDALGRNHGEDFERIDRDRHWAGFAVMRAGQVQKLADLPPDGDAMSLLLRLALQTRVECRDLPLEEMDRNNWVLASHAETLNQRESALIAASISAQPWTGPLRAIAGGVVKQIGPRWLDVGAEASAGLSAFLMVAGIGLAGFGYGGAALSVAALGAFAGAVCGAWSGLRQRLWSHDRGERLRNIVPFGVDAAALITLITLTLVNGWSGNLIPQIALPVLALGLARLASIGGAAKGCAFWQDRTLHLAAYAIAAAMGYLNEALALFALIALAHLTLRSATEAAGQLTGDH